MSSPGTQGPRVEDLSHVTAEPFWALLYLAANSYSSMSQTWVSHATEVVEAQRGKGTPEGAVSINHCHPQGRLQGGPQGRERSKPAPPRDEPCPCPGACGVGQVPAESLAPPTEAPRGTPIPTTSPLKASQGRHTFPTAWASLSAWGRGVRAAFLDEKGE